MSILVIKLTHEIAFVIPEGPPSFFCRSESLSKLGSMEEEEIENKIEVELDPNGEMYISRVKGGMGKKMMEVILSKLNIEVKQ